MPYHLTPPGPHPSQASGNSPKKMDLSHESNIYFVPQASNVLKIFFWFEASSLFKYFFFAFNSRMSTARSSCSKISWPSILSTMSSIAKTPTSDPNSSATTQSWTCSAKSKRRALSKLAFSRTKMASCERFFEWRVMGFLSG